MTIRHQVVIRPAPSTSAAISSSQGTVSKKPFMIQMPSGSSNAALTRITPSS